MNPKDDTLADRYLHLWNAALPAIRKNEIAIDSVLASEMPDARRGLTLITKPDAVVQTRILKLFDRLRAIEPDQYYYPTESLHVTILSLFTATVEPERFAVNLPGYLAAIESALNGARPFQIVFSGITASPGAIMIQGFPEGLMLEEIRMRLRNELQARDLSVGVDVRYRNITAHITAVRFQKALRDASKFADALEEYRQETFGKSTANELSLTRNDWYASPECTTTLCKYNLSAAG